MTRPATRCVSICILIIVQTLGGCAPRGEDSASIYWTSRDSGFGESAVVAAAFGLGRFVIVGEDGKIAISEDGVQWTRVESTFGRSSIRNVAYAAGRFVAVGADNSGGGRTVSTSLDGITWTAIRPGRPETLRGIAFGSGYWLVVGDGGVVLRSRDLTHWENVSPPDSSMWISAIHAEDRFVISGRRERLAWSSDGSDHSWTCVNPGGNVTPGCELGPECNDVDDVTFTGTTFVAVTHPDAEVLVSPDLVQWTRQRPGVIRLHSGFWVAFHSDSITLVGGGRGNLLLSTDRGQSWRRSYPGFGANGIIALTEGRGRFIVGGMNGHLAVGVPQPHGHSSGPTAASR